MPTYRAVGFLRHCCPWGQVRYNASATDYAARSIATQTRCFGKLQATAGNLAVVLFLGYGSPRQARLSDEATRHAPPSAARPDSSRPRTAGAIQPPECARLATCRRAFSFDLARPCTALHDLVRLSVCPFRTERTSPDTAGNRADIKSDRQTFAVRHTAFTTIP